MGVKGFLIITRSMFAEGLKQYVAWKQAQGFTVHVVTAENIATGFKGRDIRFKIRNCIRYYYRTRTTRYVLLIGDSPDLPYPEGADGPPPPTLSDPWSLPAGYYRADGQVNNQPVTHSVFSTLFYADLCDTVHLTEFKYSGDYRIYVGLIPVRSPKQLLAVLNKTMTYQAASVLNFIYSEDLYDPAYALTAFRQIRLLADGGVGMSQHLFGPASSDAEVYAAACSQPGMMFASGHGLMTPGDPSQTPGFRIGSTWLCGADGARFDTLNPLYIANACWGDSYQYGECFTEAWLRAAQGPVVMISKPPMSYPVPPGGGLTSPEQGFWTDLFASKSIGQAFYDNCAGAYADPLKLFGDPSSVVVQRYGGPPQPLALVRVAAPAINCVFDPSCRVTVSDTTSKISIPGTTGGGFLQSRTYTGQAGSAGAGLHVYEYRIDLRDVAGIVSLPAITSLTIDFGPVVNTLDYSGDGTLGDQIFVVVSGGIGSIAPVKAVKSGNSVTFDFGAGVGAGPSPGKGESSYFIGLVSTKAPRYTNARAAVSTGDTLVLHARTPAY